MNISFHPRFIVFVFAACTLHASVVAVAAQSAPTNAQSPASVEPVAANPKPSPRPPEVLSEHAKASMTRLPAAVPTASRVWSNDPALLKLEAEREALEMVDHASRLAAEDSGRRIAAMHAFIDRRNIEAKWSKFLAHYVPTLDQITFDEALKRAINHAAGIPPTPDTNDVDHLETAIEVESAVARTSWNLLNRQRRAVDTLSAFLLQEELLGDYQGWAPGYMRSMGWTPPSPAPGSAADPNAVRRRSLQMEWDRAQREQRAQTPANWQPGYEPAPAVQGETITYPGTTLPPGSTPNPPSQNGVVPAPVALGPSPARSLYSNSWWNGYADPYYDTAGFPGRDPNLGTALADDPKTYGFAPEAYTYHAQPMYWDLGMNSVPSLGGFSGGMVGGAAIGVSGGK